MTAEKIAKAYEILDRYLIAGTYEVNINKETIYLTHGPIVQQWIQNKLDEENCGFKVSSK